MMVLAAPHAFALLDVLGMKRANDDLGRVLSQCASRMSTLSPLQQMLKAQPFSDSWDMSGESENEEFSLRPGDSCNVVVD